MASRRIPAGAFALAIALLSAPVSARIVTLTPAPDDDIRELGVCKCNNH